MGGAATRSKTIVCSRAVRATRLVTSPALVPTRIVTGMRKTAGVANLRPVESALAVSTWVWVTVSVNFFPVLSYAAATANSGYPA